MSVSGIVLVEAVLARICVGTREDGAIIHDNDPKLRWLTNMCESGT